MIAGKMFLKENIFCTPLHLPPFRFLFQELPHSALYCACDSRCGPAFHAEPQCLVNNNQFGGVVTAM